MVVASIDMGSFNNCAFVLCRPATTTSNARVWCRAWVPQHDLYASGPSLTAGHTARPPCVRGWPASHCQ
jgi:hypothetical protein